MHICKPDLLSMYPTRNLRTGTGRPPPALSDLADLPDPACA